MANSIAVKIIKPQRARRNTKEGTNSDFRLMISDFRLETHEPGVNLNSKICNLKSILSLLPLYQKPREFLQSLRAFAENL